LLWNCKVQKVRTFCVFFFGVIFSLSVSMTKHHQVSKGHPGKPLPKHQINKVRRLLSARKKGSKLSYRKIADQTGVRSVATIWEMDHKNMVPSAVYNRRKCKGKPRYASKELELVAAGWIVYRHECHLDTTRKRFATFLERINSKSPSNKWLLAFSKRQHLSLRSTCGQQQSLDQNPDAYKAGIKYLNKLHSLNISPSRILCLDKITFNMPNHRVKSLAPCGS